MDEGARLVEVDMLSEPVKRAGVIVLDVDGQNVRPTAAGLAATSSTATHSPAATVYHVAERSYHPKSHRFLLRSSTGIVPESSHFLASPLREGERIKVRGSEARRASQFSLLNPHPPPLPAQGEATRRRPAYSSWAFQLRPDFLPLHRAP